MGLRHTPMESSGRLAPPWVPGVAAARNALAEIHPAVVGLRAEHKSATIFFVICFARLPELHQWRAAGVRI